MLGCSSGHTYVTANSSSRLDRFYVSRGLQQHLRNSATHVCSFSDHQAVTLRICLPSLGRAPGRGFWTLRPHLLTQENIEELRYRWQFWTRERRNYASWMAWWLLCAKRKLKSFFRWKSKIAYDEFHCEHQRLYSQLRRAYDDFYGQPALLTTIPQINYTLVKSTNACASAQILQDVHTYQRIVYRRGRHLIFSSRRKNT